jgi:hypothetical protein
MLTVIVSVRMSVTSHHLSTTEDTEDAEERSHTDVFSVSPVSSAVES